MLAYVLAANHRQLKKGATMGRDRTGRLSHGRPDAYEVFQPTGAILEGRWEGPLRTRGPAGQRPLLVLVADDNRDAADSLAMLVTIWGHNAQVAYDGAEALALALADPPDVLLLDIGMPKLNGCNLARNLRQQERFNDAMMIALTGYTGEAHCRDCLEAGFSYVLTKPVPPPTVEALLQYEVGRLLNGARPPTAPVLCHL